LLASSALFASFGAWLFRLIDPQWVNSLNWTPFVPIFLATLLSGIFWSAQTSWFGAFTRLFNWEQRSYEAVQQFAHQTVSEIDISDLPNVIAKSLVENMELERAVGRVVVTWTRFRLERWGIIDSNPSAVVNQPRDFSCENADVTAPPIYHQ